MKTPVSFSVRFGPFAVDLHTHEVRKNGARIRLVGQPFDILAVLLSRPGELVTREELRSRLWSGDTFVDFDHGLNAAVNKLREALCDSAESPRFVETLPRRGYRFIAPVEFVDTFARETPVETASAPRLAEAAGGSAQSKIAVRSAINERNPPEGALEAQGQDENEAGTAQPQEQSRNAKIWSSPFMAAALLLVVFLGITFRVRSGSPREASADLSSPLQRLRPFTGADEDAAHPAFSPDGRRLAFVRQGSRNEDSGIFVKLLTGDDQMQLTHDRDDVRPVWSPDGRTIAFARWKHDGLSLFTVPSTGGVEQKLDTHGVTPARGEVDWSPDGKTLAFTGRDALYLLPLAGSPVRRLTNPPPSAADRAPSFSADGKRVLFVRGRGSGFPEEIRVVSLDGGDEDLAASVTAEVLGAPRWSGDEKSVIFSSNFGGKPGLWRVSLEKHDLPVQINDSAADPAIFPPRHLLAYDRGSRGLNVFQLNLAAGERNMAGARILIPQTGQTDQGPAPQISPDGQNLAFMSDRSGTMEIWVSDADGRNPRQLTAIGNAGTPRWSPDSKILVFDAPHKNTSGIYTVPVAGGEARLITVDDFENRCPSWSGDGKWIYFASTRAGKFQVWKTPAQGGITVQLTQRGGHAALEAPDGKHIFYAKTAQAYPEIWQADVNGGSERLLSRDVRPVMWAAWAVVDKGRRGGIVFAQPSGDGAPIISFFDLATRRVERLAQIGIVPFWLGASRDGKRVVFDQPGWQQSQIMLVDNFR